MKSVFYILLSVFLLNNCTTNTPHQNNFKYYITDSVSFPNNNEIAESRHISNFFQLPCIYQGVDSFELRVCVGGMVTFYPNFWRYRYHNEKWILEINNGPEGKDSLTVISISFPAKDSVMKILCSDSVLGLPSQNAIPDFISTVADGREVFIEFATNKFYKALSYSNPEFYRKEKNNMRFMNIINCLNRYFKIYNPHLFQDKLSDP